MWDVFMTGAQHPSLLGAALYAQRGECAVAAELAEALLTRLVQPLTRIEAWRLLARCVKAIMERELSTYPPTVQSLFPVLSGSAAVEAGGRRPGNSLP